MEKGILVVSFGTTYDETRAKTIEAIEKAIGEAFEGRKLYRAFTSGMVMKRLAERGVYVPDVGTALEGMAKDGIKDVILQPTHLMHGWEFEKLCSQAKAYEGCFGVMNIGAPLFNRIEDYRQIVSLISSEISMADDEGLVLMGHGTDHFANAAYGALDYMFKDMGYDRIFVGTVEGYPEIDSVLRQVKARGLKKVALTPLMIVAGDHAVNDMASNEGDSWKSIFEKEGFAVRCILKGLGEYPGIQMLFVDHAKAGLA